MLAKELCARLPYGIIVNTIKGNGHLCSITKSPFGTKYGINIKAIEREYFNEEYNLRPYLRPMKSMTDEEYAEYKDIYSNDEFGNNPYYKTPNITAFYWLNAHYFDYLGLIEKGLALEAPHGMYN